MSHNKVCGDGGEAEVIKLIRCPNCGKELQRLPQNYPLYDVQCTGCAFRAQVKTSLSTPKNTIFGAGWVVIEKVMKAGFTVPPLIVNFKWGNGRTKKQEIRFYPFIPKDMVDSSPKCDNSKEVAPQTFLFRRKPLLPVG